MQTTAIGMGSRAVLPFEVLLRFRLCIKHERACRRAPCGTDVLANCEIRCAGCQGPVIKPVE